MKAGVVVLRLSVDHEPVGEDESIRSLVDLKLGLDAELANELGRDLGRQLARMRPPGVPSSNVTSSSLADLVAGAKAGNSESLVDALRAMAVRAGVRAKAETARGSGIEARTVPFPIGTRVRVAALRRTGPGGSPGRDDDPTMVGRVGEVVGICDAVNGGVCRQVLLEGESAPFHLATDELELADQLELKFKPRPFVVGDRVRVKAPGLFIGGEGEIDAMNELIVGMCNVRMVAPPDEEGRKLAFRFDELELACGPRGEALS